MFDSETVFDMNYIETAAAPLGIAAMTRHWIAAGKTAADTDSPDMAVGKAAADRAVAEKAVVEMAVDIDGPGMAADNSGCFETAVRNFVRPAPDYNFVGYVDNKGHYYLTVRFGEPVAAA